MAKKKAEEPPTQETAQGETIPVPTRGQVFGDLAKVAKPKPRGKNGKRRAK